jgi:hypothetical protein
VGFVGGLFGGLVRGLDGVPVGQLVGVLSSNLD